MESISSFELHEAIEQGTSVITSTQHLSRSLRNHYDQKQVESGKRAWNSPLIMPLSAWLISSWQNAQQENDYPLLLLNEVQTLSIWQEVIKKDVARTFSETSELWNSFSAARTAQSSWTTLHQWQIPLEGCERSLHPDHKSFFRWALNYGEILKENNWLDMSLLAAELVQRTFPKSEPIKIFGSKKIIFYGFDRKLPLYRALTKRLQESGIDIDWKYPEARGEPQTFFYEGQTERDQWLAAARWARTKLETHPDARLAIIVPNLNTARQPLEWALRQQLCPAKFLATEFEQLPYHFSLGTALATRPMVRDALNALSILINRNLTQPMVCAFLTSPFLSGVDTERSLRAKLGQWLRNNLAYQFQPREMLAEFESEVNAQYGLPVPGELIKNLSSAYQLINEAEPRQSCQSWLTLFERCLNLLGWPGDQALTSEQHQIKSAFEGSLRSGNNLDLVHDKLDMVGALNWFKRVLNNQIFQVEDSGQPLKIMGVFEAGGLEFDAIWLGNLGENDWPMPLRSEPFIPAQLQKAAGIHESEVKLNFEWNQQIQDRILGSASEIVFSYGKFQNEVQQSPSALIFRSNQIAADPLQNSENIGALHHEFRQADRIFWRHDETGLPIQSDALTAGGAHLIQSQAASPCAAYARYRLGANTVQERDPGLNPAERGTLIHSILEGVWTELKSSKGLKSASTSFLHELVTAQSQKCLRRFYATSGCGKGFFEQQALWLNSLILNWLELEKLRTESFTIWALEQPIQIDLQGLSINLKVDRIDQFEDGSLGIIDYKSGDPGSLQNWVLERPISPQIPLYARAQSLPVSLVAFAQVKAGDCKFMGVCDESRNIPFTAKNDVFAGSSVSALNKHRSLSKVTDDWATLNQIWDQQLAEMAREYMQGEASLDPHGTGPILDMDLPSFCRIDGTWQ